MKYIVTKNNPYYPSVAYCETIEEAESQAAEWLYNMKSIDGMYACQVTIARILLTETVQSDY